MKPTSGMQDIRETPKIVVSTSPSPNRVLNPGPVLLTGALTSLIDQAIEVGAEGIEMRFAPSDLGNAPDIKKRVFDAGLVFGGISTGRLSRELGMVLSHTDRDHRKAAGAALCRMIDLAEILETDILIGSAKGDQIEGEPIEAYEDRLAETLTIADEYAEGSGVQIHIEAINRYEINALRTGVETKKFIEKYDLSSCYVQLDLFHMNIEEQNLARSIADVGDKLGYFQFADSNRMWPGMGHIDFDPIFAALEQVRYLGPWSLEYQPYPDGLSAARAGIAFLRHWRSDFIREI